jgi:hypothetical protein
MTFTLIQAHAMAMILSWMVFGSTGVLFARYGRSLRLGNRRQLCGKAVWFQIHRFLLSLTSLLTLLGFFFIFTLANGRWVDPQKFGIPLFVHSIFGSIIVCCIIIQIWLALYRCHPNSRFRQVFNWSHRITGLLSFSLSFPTIFLTTILFSNFHPHTVPIFACWTAWIGIIIIIFEKIEHQQRVAVSSLTANNTQQGDTNLRPDVEAGTNTNVSPRRHNQIKLLLLFIHIIISITLAVTFIVLLCN